ncbi:hypothetical protein NIES2111_61370 (plasmid) [Nostoc sp. NIES-2111]|jgi:hypothetical protein|nr:hypothetical protein NIES2111_61370 [Nostoc sp. NIES-2111]
MEQPPKKLLEQVQDVIRLKQNSTLEKRKTLSAAGVRLCGGAGEKSLLRVSLQANFPTGRYANGEKEEVLGGTTPEIENPPCTPAPNSPSAILTLHTFGLNERAIRL